jgi:hypothetical protein
VQAVDVAGTFSQAPLDMSRLGDGELAIVVAALRKASGQDE